MTLEKELDSVDWQILTLLQENGRLSYAEIGRQVGLSLPAAAERVRRLEERGVIEGYQARVNLAKIGLPVTVFIQMRVPVETYPPFKRQVRDLLEVVECHHVTGDAAFILKVVLKSIGHLEAIVEQLSLHGQTTSAVVMSSPVTQRIITIDSNPLPCTSKNVM